MESKSFFVLPFATYEQGREHNHFDSGQYLSVEFEDVYLSYNIFLSMKRLIKTRRFLPRSRVRTSRPLINDCIIYQYNCYLNC